MNISEDGSNIDGAEADGLNCLFCYCPLYSMENCPGKNEYIESKGRVIKVCTNCAFPHRPENYEKIIDILKNR